MRVNHLSRVWNWRHLDSGGGGKTGERTGDDDFKDAPCHGRDLRVQIGEEKYEQMSNSYLVRIWNLVTQIDASCFVVALSRQLRNSTRASFGDRGGKMRHSPQKPSIHGSCVVGLPRSARRRKSLYYYLLKRKVADRI